MAGQGEIARNLHMLAGLIRDAVILGTIDDALLERGVDLAEGHGSGRRAESAEQRNIGGARYHPDLLAFQIRHAVDRTAAGIDVAKRDLPDLHDVKAGGGSRPAKLLLKHRAVEQAESCALVLWQVQQLDR